MPLDDAARRRAAETKRQRTRTKILDATYALFQSDKPVTMAAISKAAGVSEASVYRHFESKNKLVKEALLGAATPTTRDVDEFRLYMIAAKMFDRIQQNDSDNYERYVRPYIESALGELDIDVVARAVLRGFLDSRLSSQSAPADAAVHVQGAGRA